MTSLVQVTLGTYSSTDNYHKSQTTSSLANARFVTSTPGVATNLYCSWGSVIILVRVLSFLSVSLTHIELSRISPRPHLAALGLIDSLSSHIPSLPERFYV